MNFIILAHGGVAPFVFYILVTNKNLVHFLHVSQYLKNVE